MKRILCRDCGASCGNMEIALNLKLRGRAAGTFFCLACLAARAGCGEDRLREWADFWRRNGCELFARDYVGR